MFKGFKTKFLAILMSAVLTITMFPITGLSDVQAGEETVPEIEIATWSGFRKGAASFTFEDGAPSHVSDAAPLFDKYGYKASFYLVVNWDPNWRGFQEMADNGHEIGSHSNSHGDNMSGEEASSKKNINDKITQKYGCITVAYPNGNTPNKSAVLSNYIAGRKYNGSWYGISNTMGKDGPDDWCEVPAIVTGSQGINTADGFITLFQKVVDDCGWVCFATFGFKEKNNGSATYSPTDIDAIEGALKWASENNKDIWVDSLRSVAMYIKERKASEVKVISYDASTITCKLTHDIADDITMYNYPLSLRVKCESNKAEVTQGDARLESKIEGGYLYFDAIPNAGDIIIKIGNEQPTPTPTPEQPTPTPTPEQPTPTPTATSEPNVTPTLSPTAASTVTPAPTPTSEPDNTVTAPKKPKSLKVKNLKGKKLSVKWKKVKGAEGYQVQYSLKKSFSKSKKAKTKKKSLVKTSLKIKKLKKKKTYYVRVRAYVKNADGKKVYSKWTKAKKVKIKK